MSQSSEGSQGSEVSRSRSRSRSRTSSPRPQDSTVTLAKIFMIEENGKILDWDGQEPKHKRLFVYVTIGDTTYKGYFTKKKDSNCMRSGPYHSQKLQGTSFLHCGNGSILLPLMRGTPNFNNQDEDYCRIYKYNYSNDFWYKLYDYDDKLNTTEIDKIRSVNVSSLGKPHAVPSDYKIEYTPHCRYFPGEYLYLLMRETGLSSRRTRTRPRTSSISEQQPLKKRRIENAGGGKTRRKCKVNKRRNRRRRNTMKRRKTTAKRRHR